MNRKHLYIGELAQLVGVSTKTVRHYHKVGLLLEPERTDSGYRLYTHEYVQRLRLIRQMREIGLSLPQIRFALDKSDDETGLQETLQDLLEGIEEQIHELSERRNRILQLLIQPALRHEDLNDAPSLYLEEAYQKLGHLLPHLDEGLFDQEAQLEAVLGQYNWSDDLPEFLAGVIRYFEEHPQQYQQFVGDLQAIWRQLQSAEASDETLRALAATFVERHRAVLDQWLQMAQDKHIPSSFQNVLQEMLGEVSGETQQRFSSYLIDAYQATNDDRNAS